MRRIENTHLPTTYGEFEMIAYESQFKDFPHIVLMTKKKLEIDSCIVRIHSECMTGDIFSSQRCDCGEQLDYSLNYINKHGGVLVYLRQEGRGIGLVNKMKAYNLQDKGLDTFAANIKLGLHQDARNYQVAIDILEELGIKSVRLLTNNPDKLKIFDNSRIQLKERLPIEVSPSSHNSNYLKAKRDQKGHFLNKI